MSAIICRRCDTPKASEDFGVDRRTPTGRKTICNDCEKRQREERWEADPAARAKYLAYQRRYNRTNKAKRNEKSRAYYQRKKLELYVASLRRFLVEEFTVDYYLALCRKQKNRCAVCGKKETNTYKGVVRRLHVDHCHDTLKIRGLLCSSCNMGVGKFYDNPELLRKAADYLESCRAASQKVDLETRGDRRVGRRA